MPSDTAIPAPVILAFDTSAAHCAAALLCGDRIVAQAREEMGRGQAERLVPLLEEVLAEAGRDWSDLTALAVGTGPGNFTGIRISVSLARGLALALKIPAHGVTGFQALAWHAGKQGAALPYLATLPAPRDHLYGQLIPSEGTPLPAETFATGAPPQALLPQGVTLLGAIAGALPGPLNPATAIAGAAALRQAPEGAPAPFYLRPADAAPPRDAPPRIIP